MKPLSFTIFSAVFFTLSVNANILYVKIIAKDLNDGTSWANAYTNLQDALAVAKEGDEIWVAKGTYTPDIGSGNTRGNRFSSFRLKSSVAMYGGFNGTETALGQRDLKTNITVLSGDLKGDDKTVGNDENSYHVITGGALVPGTSIDGFAVAGGNANGASFFFFEDGGGIFLDHRVEFDNKGAKFIDFPETDSFLLIVNCTFSENSAKSEGGAIFAVSGKVEVLNSRFINNSAADGGAIKTSAAESVILESSFVSNSAESGGGIWYGSSSMTTISNCQFANNSATFDGGGIFNSGGDHLIVKQTRFVNNIARDGGGLMANAPSIIVNCSFLGNSARNNGGGISNGEFSFADLEVNNCVFSTNSATASGGGIYNTLKLELSTSSFSANSAKGDGGAISNQNDLTTGQCIFSKNVAGTLGGGINNAGAILELGINLFWENADGSADPVSADIHLDSTSFLFSGSLDDQIQDEPLFVDADGEDNVSGTDDDNLQLLSGSPAIDSGWNGGLPGDSADLDTDGESNETIPLDLNLDPRIFNETVDLGAYEATFNPSPSVEFSSTTSSVNESALTADIQIRLKIPMGSNLGGSMSVVVEDTGTGSASPNDDFIFSSPITLTFPADSTDGASQTITIDMVDDTLFEGDETIKLILTNIQGNAKPGIQTTHQITLSDDDMEPLSRGLIGHWSLDAGMWTGKNDEVIDSSGKGNHGTSQNGAQTLPGGKVDRAGNFDGKDDNVDLGGIEAGHPLQLCSGGTLMGWFNQRPGDRYQRIIDKSTSGMGTNGYSLIADPLQKAIWIDVSGANYRSEIGVYKFNQWTHVAVVITESAFEIYINGVKVNGSFISGSAKFPVDVAANLRIGTWNHSTGREFNGLLDDLRIYSRALTADTIKAIHEEADPNLALIAHYPMDEGNGCTVADSIGLTSGKEGLLKPSCSPTSNTGPTWSTQPSPTGSSLEFDGDNDHVDLGQIEAGHPLQLSAGGTLSAWFKQRPGDRYQRIIDKSTSGMGTNGYSLIADPLQKAIWIDVSGANYRSEVGVYEFNQWTHVTAVITKSAFEIYINGVKVTGSFISGNAKLPIDVATNMRIGTWNHSTGREFSGFLDDLRIYSRALTADTIRAIHEEADPNLALIAHYPFDEGNGCTAANSIDDTSGKDGELKPDCSSTNSAGPAWSTQPSSMGSSLKFDGDNDYVDLGQIEMGHPLQLNSGGTLSAWFNQRPGDRYQRILDKSTSGMGTNGYALIADPVQMAIWIDVSGATYRSKVGVYELGQWTHVAAIITENAFEIYINGIKVNGSFISGSVKLPVDVATNMRIGTWNHSTGREFNGFLDDLRIYSRALTADTIRAIHEEADPNLALIAHYPFDEGNGCIAANSIDDASGKDGELKPSCSSANSVGPVWSTQPSPMGSSLEFDGDKDYVDLGQIETGHPLQLNSGATLSAWFNQRPGDRYQRIIDKSTNGMGTNGYSLIADPAQKAIWIDVSGANYRSEVGVYELGQWTHVTAVITESAFEIYINGIKVNGSFILGSAKLPVDMATNMRIGSWNHSVGREFNGFLDDLRIYSRTLSSSKIAEIYGEGSLIDRAVVDKAGSNNNNNLKVKSARSRIFPLDSQTMYEDAEDGTIAGWLAYGNGNVLNVEDASGNRIISTQAESVGAPFRLGLPDHNDWNNTEEFAASFAVLMEEDAAIYFRVDTSEGEKYLCYQPGLETVEIDQNVICFGLGIEANGQWHTILRSLATDLEQALPGVTLVSIKDFFVFGSVLLDDLMLLEQNSD